MSAAVGPGALLVAVDSYDSGGYRIDRGRIYTATEVYAYDEFRGLCDRHGPDCRAGGVRLREAPTPSFAVWCQASFRPVGRPAADLVRQFTQSEPVPA